MSKTRNAASKPGPGVILCLLLIRKNVKDQNQSF